MLNYFVTVQSRRKIANEIFCSSVFFLHIKSPTSEANPGCAGEVNNSALFKLGLRGKLDDYDIFPGERVQVAMNRMAMGHLTCLKVLSN